MTSPTRKANPLPRICAATIGIATGIALLQSVAFYRFKLAADAKVQFIDALGDIAPPMLALVAASCLLAFAFQRMSATLLRPWPLFLGLMAMLALSLPMEAVAATLYALWRHDLPLADFPAQLLRREAFVWWVDACMSIFAYLAQAGYAVWQRNRLQDEAWQQAQDEGLELRLRLLQGQLKPHFLFNALNSISALVRTADRDLAADALVQLSALLRHAVHASKQEWLSTADEMAFLDDYLNLQLLRYGERLTIEVEIGNAPWASLACPPLLFENAIHHGVERHDQACSIAIGLALEQGLIRLTIRNALVQAQSPRQGHGIGQAATRERLAILYGGAASLHTESGADAYTATLAFPARPFHEN
jgi:two-component system sensor histidine kinase AlgZ